MNSRPARTREIVAIARSKRAVDGLDFHTRRACVPLPERSGPLLFIDEIGPVEFAAGEAWRPHPVRCRDVQSLTYVLEGEWDCSDDVGGRITMCRGDVCWRATRGEAIRMDGPSARMREGGGRVHCLEVALRLSTAGMAPERHRLARSTEIPRTAGPARVRVMVGSLLATHGAFETGESLIIGDWLVSSGATVTFPVVEPQVALLYAHQDVVWIGAEDLALREGQLAVLGPGDQVVLRGPERALRPARVLFLAGGASEPRACSKLPLRGSSGV